MREWALRLIRAEALAKKGNIAGKAGECRQVLADQEARNQVLPTLPYNPDALTCLAEAELSLHHPEKAIPYLERSVVLTTRYSATELPKARCARPIAAGHSARPGSRALSRAKRARRSEQSARRGR
jgi:hypothetical protein